MELTLSAAPDLAEFTDLLSLLPENVAEGFRDQFLGLLDRARLEVAIPGATPASIAGNHIIRLRVGGYGELLAAARSAVKG